MPIPGALIGAGVLIGISLAGHSLALTCIGEIVPKRSRPLGQGIFQGSLITASAFSPLIAHAFVLHTWRDIYWVAMAHNIAGLIGVALSTIL
jgi:MFS family permease